MCVVHARGTKGGGRENLEGEWGVGRFEKRREEKKAPRGRKKTRSSVGGNVLGKTTKYFIFLLEFSFLVLQQCNVIAMA